MFGNIKNEFQLNSQILWKSFRSKRKVDLIIFVARSRSVVKMKLNCTEGYEIVSTRHGGYEQNSAWDAKENFRKKKIRNGFAIVQEVSLLIRKEKVEELQ